MKSFFKFDDNRVIFITMLLLTLIISIFTIVSILTESAIFTGLLLITILFIILTVFSYNEGIHFNYKKEKIVIVDGFIIKILNMNDVKYFAIEEVSKKKKKNIVSKFSDSYKQIGQPSYVYNNGKVFKIIFHLKKGNLIISYHRLYKTSSIERISKQLSKFQEMKESFMKYKKLNK